MASTVQNVFASLRLHCSFTPQTVRKPRNYIRHKSYAVISEPQTLGAEELQIHPTRISMDEEKRRTGPKLALADLRHLFAQDGGALQAANILRENSELFKRMWFDDVISDEFITALVMQTNLETVESVVFAGRPRRHTLAAAILAFSAKKSVRGVASMERLAFKRRILQGPDSADLWFALIRAYGALDRLDTVRKTFKAARDAGAWSPQSTRHTNIYLNAIHMDIHLIFIRARQLIDAGAVADATTFNILLKACMRAKDGKRATMVVKWMKDADIQADTVTWSSLIKVRSYTDDFKGVLAIRDEMEKEGFEPTTGVWGSLLVACGAAQHHETALMMWREAKAALGGPASVPSNLYNAMLTACNACGQGERTLSLLEEMKAAGVTPGVKSYNLAIKACEGQPGHRLRLEQLAIALKLYEEMRTCGMHPDLITYGTLIELCAEGRQGALARRLRDRMDEDGVKPNVVVMTSLLKALARAGLIEDCLDTFGTMVWGPARVRPNRVTFRTLVRELRQAGALGAALRAYEGMRRAQHAPSNVEFQELIAAAAEAALAEGDPELQAQVASLCNIGSTLEILDLHGMSTLEARAAVLCVLSMLMTEYHDTGLPPSTLTIITGKGVHSESGQAVLPSTVYRLLSDELHMPVDTENNSNAGRLVIDPEQLLRWVRARVATRQRHQRAKKKTATSTIDDS